MPYIHTKKPKKAVLDTSRGFVECKGDQRPHYTVDEQGVIFFSMHAMSFNRDNCMSVSVLECNYGFISFFFGLCAFTMFLQNKIILCTYSVSYSKWC